jgi:DNA-binding NarL/FixJ family response regulator
MIPSETTSTRQFARAVEPHRAILDALEILSSAAVWQDQESLGRAIPIDATTPGASWPASDSAPSLSPREREVAALIALGSSNRQIADALSISTATVERHVSNIFNKLGVHSRTRVAVWAFARGLTGAPSS